MPTGKTHKPITVDDAIAAMVDAINAEASLQEGDAASQGYVSIAVFGEQVYPGNTYTTVASILLKGWREAKLDRVKVSPSNSYWYRVASRMEKI